MHSEKVAGANALNKKPPFFLYAEGGIWKKISDIVQ
jgi:hypothetical protein